MKSLAEVITIAEQLWPTGGAEDWDAVGLVCGDPAANISRIHLTIDATPEVADEAVELGADLLLAHHPLLLRGVTSIAEDQFKGLVLARLIRANCALYSAHTNADVVASGTSAVLANLLGLESQAPIATLEGSTDGIGRVGKLSQTITLGALARRLADLLPQTAGGIRVAGEFDRPVQYVALCAGAGDSYLAEPTVLSSDVYVTSDLRHHPASAFRENAKLNNGPALIDISHWAAEWLWLDTAAQQLQKLLPEISVSVSEIRTDPWDFNVIQ